jgi:putative tricarboxylic transport membrane protein
MNIIIVIVWIGLGIFLMAYSYNLGLGSLSNAGAGLMPFLVGALLLISSLFVGYGNVMKKLKHQQAPPEKKARQEAGINMKKSVIVIVSLILYALLMEEIGFIIATFLLLAILFNALGVKRLAAIGGSLVTVLSCYFVFTYLGQRFPPGILRYFGFY